MKLFSDSLLAVLIGLAFGGLGLLVLRWSLSQIVRSRRSRFWPSVTGRIVSAEVGKNPSNQGLRYWPIVRYEYQVEGVDYNGDTLGFGQNGNGNLGMASALVAQYPAGQEAKIFYDPKSPKISCLQPGLMNGGTYIAVLIGFVLTFGGLFIALVGPFVFVAS